MNPLDSLTSLSSLSSLSNSASTAASAASTAASAASSAASFFGSRTLADWILILLGLLLIAAGIFSFDKVRETIIEAGKTAAVAA